MANVTFTLPTVGGALTLAPPASPPPPHATAVNVIAAIATAEKLARMRRYT
ncbi:hypothetical protein [Gemmatimonas sp.]|uniref:hypothetical protein n=1 Tax=Gemmatimonas sp. TaxID=1962908 RepID=UPI00334173DF